MKVFRPALDTHNAAKLCGITRPTMCDWCAAGKVSCEKLEGIWYIYAIPEELLRKDK